MGGRGSSGKASSGAGGNAQAVASAAENQERARALEEQARVLERELNTDMSSTDAEARHSPGWRRETQAQIDRLRERASKLLYGE